ncbi:MAG: tautomerase family protein, partial [Oscillospiraceae bacterium]|nr:tautomerase family protein [Oscillospiraceae bacterium]
GKDREYKKALADCVHEGLMEAFGIDDDDRYQRII